MATSDDGPTIQPAPGGLMEIPPGATRMYQARGSRRHHADRHCPYLGQTRLAYVLSLEDLMSRPDDAMTLCRHCTVGYPALLAVLRDHDERTDPTITVQDVLHVPD